MSVRPWIPVRRTVAAPSSKEINQAIPVPAPPEIKEVVPPHWFQKAVPWLMVIAIVGMLGIFLASGARRVSPMMLMFPLMMLMGGGGMMAGHGNSGGPNTAEINGLRRKYLEMLTNLRRKVHGRAKDQYAYLAHFAPPPEALAAMVGGPRMWERTRPQNDPTYIVAPRVGVATQKLGGGMTMEDAAPETSLEPVSRVFGERFQRAHQAVAGMPVAIDFKTHRAVQFFGPGDTMGAIRAILLQLAVFHPPNLVLIAVVTEDPEAWDWIKWLPHNQHPTRRDALGTERMVYTREQASTGLADILAGRGDFSTDAQYTGAKPWLIVVADHLGAIPGAGEGMEAVTVIRRGDSEDDLEVLGARVEVDVDGRARKRKLSADDPLTNWASAVDTVDVAHARRVARVMARWRAATDQQAAAVRSQAGGGVLQSWASVHNVDDVGTMGTSLWRSYAEGDPERMRVPIGWGKTGAPMMINIKEVAEQGMGSHGVILGTTGSGKSTFLVNMMLALLAHHTPEQLNVIYVDYKGDATFDGFEGLNHTVEIVSNLSSPDMIDRLEAVLRGEVERRQKQRSTMGELSTGKKFRDAKTYLKARERGADIPAFPTLMVVVDEFTALLKDHPEFRDVFEHLGRQGRSDRVCLVLATQSLGGVPVGQLMSNAGWTIAMKTATAMDSASAIETKDAYYLEEAGEGYLKVGGAEPVYFRGANTEEHYFPPDASAKAASERLEATGVSGVASFGVAAVPVPGLNDASDEETTVVVRSSEEIAAAPEVGQVILRQLDGQGEPCRKLWLPPLLTPRPVGQLVEASGLVAGEKAVLNLPIGLLDVPFKHAQEVFSVDLTDSNLCLLGRSRSGKSVAMQTLAIAAARLNSPSRLQIYGLDFSGDSRLLALEDLPHVAGVGVHRDIDAVSRVIAEVEEVVKNRAQLFREHRISNMAAYRDRLVAGTAPDDGYGDVLLLLDGWDVFKENHEPLTASVAALTNGGLAVGVHVVLALQVQSNLGRNLNQSFSTRVDFKLNSPELSGVNNKRLAESIPGDVPGRALDLATNLHLMIGAPRLDDVEAVDDAGLRDAIAAISAQWKGQEARQVRVLPERVISSDLALPEDWKGSRWTVPIGLYERDLTTVAFDFMSDRNLTIFGSKDCGKTHQIASIMSFLTSKFTADEVKFIVVDLKGSKLLDYVDEDYVLRWTGEQEVANPEAAKPGQPQRITRQVARSGLITNPMELAPAMVEVARALEKRAPTGTETREQRRNRSWWSGPEIFLFVDDYAMVANAAPQAFAPLAPHWGNGHQLGIHGVVGCPMALANRLLGSGNSLPKLTNDAGGAALIMDGLRSEGPVLNQRLESRPKGRGVLLTNQGREVIQTPVFEALED